MKWLLKAAVRSGLASCIRQPFHPATMRLGTPERRYRLHERDCYSQCLDVSPLSGLTYSSPPTKTVELLGFARTEPTALRRDWFLSLSRVVCCAKRRSKQNRRIGNDTNWFKGSQTLFYNVRVCRFASISFYEPLSEYMPNVSGGIER
jgi:hypothetical protein